MHEAASSPAYEQETVVSSMDDVERAPPAASVSGQVNWQSPWRALTVKAQAEERSDNTETINGAEKIMMISVEDRAPGEVRDC
jgi:hypothetical protein